jgi:ABC-2 type transport system ATP-binding protein
VLNEPPGGGTSVADRGSDKALVLEGVGKSFTVDAHRVVALDGISLDARKGVVTGLIGPDGAGKTTLMRLATGLLTVDAGRIEVLGIDVVAEPLRVQASVGYMPQRFGLYEDLSVRENLDLYADLQGVHHADRPERYRELMHMTGLGPFMSRLAGKLSGGMKQKLGLACTLVRAPSLLLLDEPTVGVDPVSRRELWSIVYRLVKDEAMSVLLSTAYLDEAERCDEVALIHEGKLLGNAPPSEFSATMRGRTFTVSTAAVGKRELQERLSSAPEIIDAVIQADHVRVVTAEPARPDPAALLPGLNDVKIAPVPPRFEDRFVAELRARQQPESTAATTEAPTPRADGDGPVISVHDLERRFGDFIAVKRITFEVDRGEVFGLLGANGAGKSTTFRMLCGLLPASGGRLTVGGVDLRTAAAAARARIGYMAQKFSLYQNLTVLQNLSFFSGAYGLGGGRRRKRIQWALEEFDLSDIADTESGTLSLGYKQRLALSCALMHEPDILFLDEPTSGVDPLARRGFWHRINLLAQSGVTIMVTTHFMEEAEYCDRLAIMSAGEILAIGTPADIKSGRRREGEAEPSMEDAFIDLIESAEAKATGAAA